MLVTIKTIEEIEQILYYGIPGGKRESEASEIINYVRLAYEEELEEVPAEYREFAQLVKHHWSEMRQLSHANQKLYLQKQVLGLVEIKKGAG